MKILFVQKEGGIFGAENFQLNIIPALLAKDISIEFLRLYTDYQGGINGDFIERLNSLGVKTHQINIGKFPKWGALKAIKKMIKVGDYDLVHTHLIHADLHLSLIKLLMGGISCPWVSTKHGYDNSFTAKHGFNAARQSLTPYYLLVKLSERLCDKSYTISHGLRNFFIATKATKANKMGMIHYGFDLPEVTSDYKDSTFRKFKQQIIIAGRLVGFKGHHYLLESLSKLKDTHPEVGLVIAGSGQEEESLKQLVNELKLKERVYFAGYSKEVTKWMYNSDIVAVPSISEGFGVVFLETFSCKKPVIAWDVPAGNELMEHGKTGYLAEPYSPKDYASVISHVLQHPQEGKKVGEKAYDLLKNYFTLERMTDETIAFYRKVLD